MDEWCLQAGQFSLTIFMWRLDLAAFGASLLNAFGVSNSAPTASAYFSVQLNCSLQLEQWECAVVKVNLCTLKCVEYFHEFAKKQSFKASTNHLFATAIKSNQIGRFAKAPHHQSSGAPNIIREHCQFKNAMSHCLFSHMLKTCQQSHPTGYAVSLVWSAKRPKSKWH